MISVPFYMGHNENIDKSTDTDYTDDSLCTDSCVFWRYLCTLEIT